MPRRILICLTLACGAAAAQERLPEPALEELLVTGGRDDVETLGGSAQLVDAETLSYLDYTDVNRVMSLVPGVYVRHEDGYGLRPNIGIRGANAERSQKITLMEDGVLIAPAPYSAPAAYYMPNVNRMSAVEVLKGPASIQHGPHTVGGAINLATRPVPEDRSSEVDLTLGSDSYRKLHAVHGARGERFGFLVEGLHFGSAGFKQLDGGGDTGFDRNDLNAKLQWRSQADAPLEQQVTVKAGYADEVSDETYLGLADADFAANPYRRYRASQLDEFESEHRQLHVSHRLGFRDARLETRLYRNDFDRAWNKLDGFIDGLAPDFVLEHPDVFAREMGLLRGEIDSNGSESELIDVTNNDRAYGSQGIELKGGLDVTTGRVDHALALGLRYHNDHVERNHQVRGYTMDGGELVFDGVPRAPKVLNRQESDAYAVFLRDEIYIGDWRLTAGLRYEDIRGESIDHLTGARRENDQEAVIPALSAFWQVTSRIGLLAGVHAGFSPAGPGAADSVEPEESINYEYGLRYRGDRLTADVIGFFSDYDNLLGRCRVSDPGCEVGQEFNGGRAEIAGLELDGRYVFELTDSLAMPASLNYTYTESAFQTGFLSGFSQWGLVRAGDALPYLPEHSARFELGVESQLWQLLLAVTHQSAMREVTGAGPVEQDTHTDALTLVELSARLAVNDALELQLGVDNATDERAIVSHRPFGARPNPPRLYKARLSYSF